MAERDGAWAGREAVRLATEFWPLRHRMQGKLIALDRAIAQARWMTGPVVFTDAADATSSGATGDSNVIILGLREAGYPKRVLAQIVDPQAAAARPCGRRRRHHHRRAGRRARPAALHSRCR